MTGMAIFWLVLLILFLMAEGATAALTTIWFAAGAMAAMIAAALDGALWLQISLFVLVSILLLLALRPLLKTYITPRQTKTNIDAILGKQGVVLEEINNLKATGRVKLGAMEWSARSADDAVIPVNAVIRVEKIEGVKVLVKQEENVHNAK
ncbi:MAG: NfeD family protein [Oscillospiraceae bacterium]|nr:NfeD family protein [Oscillospiraceae bacterium]